MAAPTSITEYLDDLSPAARTAVDAIRSAIADVVPDAVEKIAYGIPTFAVEGRNLVHVAGWKRHVSVYPVPTGDPKLLAELARYQTGKGTLQFPLDAELPIGLIRRVAAQLVADRG